MGSEMCIRDSSRGSKEGVYEGWYDNGEKSYEGNYRMGEKDGVWIFFNEDGTVLHRKSYLQGREVGN